ncbi:MAG: ATP-grasp domain-containing protein [Thermodesulfobacteriota bacterium]
MRLLEYEGKAILRQRGIPVPRSFLITKQDELVNKENNFPFPWMVKGQILDGGRGKAGLIQQANSLEEAESITAKLLAQENVAAVLIEEKINCQKEIFLAIILDRREATPVLMYSAQGGMEVEASSLIRRFPFLNGDRWPFYRFIDLYASLGWQGKSLMQISEITRTLGKIYFQEDALAIEVNPLGLTAEGTAWALDAKIVLDDEAMFRHLHWKEWKSFQLEEGAGLEKEAKALGLAYVPLPGGEVGVIAGGAGLGMATMDALVHAGAKPGVFLDVGGGVAEEVMAEAVRLVRQTPGIKGILVNIFGGINNCQIIARGIVHDLKRQGSSPIPLVVKTRGHFQNEGWAILESQGIEVIKMGTTAEAVQRLLSLLSKKEK